MHRVFTFIMLFVSNLVLAESNKIDICPTIKVAGGDWLKYEHIERFKGSATGKGIELLKKFDETFNVDIQIMPNMPFPRQLKQLKEGKLDFMIGLFNIASRRSDFQLTLPYYIEPLHIYALKNKFENRVKLKDLFGLTVGLRRDSSYGDKLDKYFQQNNFPSIEVKDSKSVAKLLLKGRVDYFVATPTAKEEFLLISDHIVQYNSIAEQETSFAFSKLSPCVVWLSEFNNLIKEAQTIGI